MYLVSMRKKKKEKRKNLKQNTKAKYSGQGLLFFLINSHFLELLSDNLALCQASVWSKEPFRSAKSTAVYLKSL